MEPFNLTRWYIIRTVVNPPSAQRISVARRLTAPDALEQMERTGRKRREFVELRVGDAHGVENRCIGEREEDYRLRLTGSNARGRRRDRGRAAALLDDRSRPCGRCWMTGFTATGAARLSRFSRIVAAAGSVRRFSGRSRRLHGKHTAPAGRKRQHKSANQCQRLNQRFAHD